MLAVNGPCKLPGGCPRHPPLPVLREEAGTGAHVRLPRPRRALPLETLRVAWADQRAWRRRCLPPSGEAERRRHHLRRGHQPSPSRSPVWLGRSERRGRRGCGRRAPSGRHAWGCLGRRPLGAPGTTIDGPHRFHGAPRRLARPLPRQRLKRCGWFHQRRARRALRRGGWGRLPWGQMTAGWDYGPRTRWPSNGRRWAAFHLPAFWCHWGGCRPLGARAPWLVHLPRLPRRLSRHRPWAAAARRGGTRLRGCRGRLAQRRRRRRAPPGRRVRAARSEVVQSRLAPRSARGLLRRLWVIAHDAARREEQPDCEGEGKDEGNQDAAEEVAWRRTVPQKSDQLQQDLEF